MIRQMEQTPFAEFVAALWTKQGWQTQVTTKKRKIVRHASERGRRGVNLGATGDG